MNEDALFCRHIVTNLKPRYEKYFSKDSDNPTVEKPMAFIHALIEVIYDFAPKTMPVKTIELKTIKKFGKTKFWITIYKVSPNIDEQSKFIEEPVNEYWEELNSGEILKEKPTLLKRNQKGPIQFVLLPEKTYIHPYFEICLTFADDAIDDSTLYKRLTNQSIYTIICMYQSLVYPHQTELMELYDKIIKSYSNNNMKGMVSKSKNFFEKLDAFGLILTPDSPEAWMYAIYGGEYLQKKIIGDPVYKKIIGNEAFCSDSKKRCNSENAPSFPCYLVCLRNRLLKEETGPTKKTITKIQEINPDNIQDFPMDTPPPEGEHRHPRHVAFVQWSFKHRREIEYFNTVLFAIYQLSKKDEKDGRRDNQAENPLNEIDKLWKLIDGSSGKKYNLPKTIRKYLKQWQDRKELYLCPEWLSAWFVCRLFESKAFTDHRPGSTFSPEERLRFHQRFATICLFSLFWMRVFGDTHQATFSDVPRGYQEYLESLIYMLCEYAHIDGELPRTARLSKTMRFMWTQQAVLYTVAEYYRDHLHHVLEVCLMGLFFLSIRKSERETSRFFNFRTSKISLLSLSKQRKLAGPKILRNWIVGALLHDVGYVLKLIEYPISHLAFFQEKTSEIFWENMGQQLKILQQEQSKESCERLKTNIGLILSSENMKNVDHGVLSALVIAAHLNGVNKQEWINDMQWAIEAAALHNYPEEAPLKYREHPMAFLLHLCDNLQEWNRPLIQGEKLRQAMLVNIVRAPTMATHKNRPFVNYLTMSVKYEDAFPKLIGNRLRLKMRFGPADELNCYPPLIWIGHTQQMQRINNCQLPITLTLQHPVRIKKLKNGDPDDEMVSLQTFLRTNGQKATGPRNYDENPTGNSVLRQWVQDVHKADKWFCYKKNNDYEMFSFELDKCDGKSVIEKTPDDYIAKYISWVTAYRGLSDMDEYDFF